MDFLYDWAGNLLTYTNRSRAVQSFVDDNRNRQTAFTWSDGTSGQNIVYDAASRVKQITNDYSTINHTFYDDNRLWTEQEWTTVLGGTPARMVTYTYDPSGNIIGVTRDNGTSNGNASVTLKNCTLNKNSAASGAGGIYNDALNPGSSGIATVILRNTILRAGSSGANLYNDSAAGGGSTITSQGNNLSSDAAGGDATIGPGGFLNAAGDKRNTDPKLDVLGNNGGPTDTCALLSNSPAIDAGNDSLAPSTDQRGFGRNGISDIGAFEFNGIAPTPTPTPTPTPNPTATPTPTPVSTPTPTPVPRPFITSPLSITATAGQQFTYQIVASNSPTSFAALLLPSGLSLNSNLGIITGIPSQAETANVTITASNSGGTDSTTLTITVQSPPPPLGVQITSGIVTARTGQAFSYHIVVIQASSSATVSISGLPTGLGFDTQTGVISGTPTQTGSFVVTITVTDGGATVSGSFQLTFTSDPAVPVITSPGDGEPGFGSTIQLHDHRAQHRRSIFRSDDLQLYWNVAGRPYLQFQHGHDLGHLHRSLRTKRQRNVA